jgi:hypothetical protein
MFTNIAASGPALALFPASQRVTYLYYLGRFNFENNHYRRAAICLEEAYFQTPPSCQRHRRQILTYLIPCKMLLGIFPSEACEYSRASSLCYVASNYFVSPVFRATVVMRLLARSS